MQITNSDIAIQVEIKFNDTKLLNTPDNSFLFPFALAISRIPIVAIPIIAITLK